MRRQTDHAGTALAQLPRKHQGKPRIVAWFNAFMRQVQELEDALFSIMLDTRIDDAEGIQLDLIGRLLKLPRGNASDGDEYRTRLKARIRARLSSGMPEQIYAVFVALLGSTVRMRLEDRGGAAFTLELLDSLDPDLVDVCADFLAASRAPGVYAVLEWFEGDEADVFTTDVCCFQAGAVLAGVTRIDVVGSTAGFPDTGSLVLSPTLPEEETVTYARKTATSFEGLSMTANAHAAGDVVSWAAAPGLGFGSATDATIGGDLAGARGV